jgi:hypothetical protein
MRRVVIRIVTVRIGRPNNHRRPTVKAIVEAAKVIAVKPAVIAVEAANLTAPIPATPAMVIAVSQSRRRQAGYCHYSEGCRGQYFFV